MLAPAIERYGENGVSYNSEEALLLAIRLLGTRKEVYEDILFVYTGYHNFEQFIEREGNEQ